MTCNVFVKKLMKAIKGSRVFYNSFINVNDYIAQIKWQAENDGNLIFLVPKICHEVKF